jgi:hypothetical protein
MHKMNNPEPLMKKTHLAFSLVLGLTSGSSFGSGTAMTTAIVPNKLAFVYFTNWVSAIYEYWIGNSVQRPVVDPSATATATATPEPAYTGNSTTIMDADAFHKLYPGSLIKFVKSNPKVVALQDSLGSSVINSPVRIYEEYLRTSLKLAKVDQADIASSAMTLLPVKTGTTETEYVKTLRIAARLGTTIGLLGTEDQKQNTREYLEKLIKDARILILTRTDPETGTIDPIYRKLMNTVNNAYIHLGGTDLVPSSWILDDAVIQLLGQLDL